MINTVIGKLIIFSSVYIVVLIFISPFIDHLFSTLDQDKLKKETNIQILIEIILHVIVLTITWYWANKYLTQILEHILKVKIKEHTKTAIDFMAAIALVGLQTNLIDKLRYVSIDHPFRIKDLYN
tara:strand:+ start:1796 stop:2170 length:375 start_codon:yes stop_codon:yes gene_type:complete